MTVETPSIVVVDPATEEEVASFAEHSPEQIEAALAAAHEAFGVWRRRPVEERAEVLRAVAGELRSRAEELRDLITREMGKPLAEAAFEVEKCASACEYFAAHGPAELVEQRVDETSIVAYEPIGVIFAVMPWNFPLWQVIRFAAPALLAGNTALLKHAPNVSGTAVALEEVFAAAGAPAGVFTSLLVAPGNVPEVSEKLIADPRVAAVTLTGSERAGAFVAAAAGAALKKSVLELGGSDPFVVLADADLDHTIAHAVKGRLMTAGQTCIAPKRFLVDERIAEEFEERLVAALEAVKIGDPREEGVGLGPLARLDILETLERQVAATIEEGAELKTGGTRLDRPGYFFPPTVLSGVKPGMTAFTDETFGPVVAITPFATEDEAITLANDTRYGLGATVWSTDTDRAHAVARRIDSGAVSINTLVASDPKLPFGGIKRSGYGRELSTVGLHEFTNIRTYKLA
ncbi:NAD-dependent succinate-semialdehyde dehydrogenase [Solirubrobacter soli]|uniref:NAD-dependent succinate-semialdehyde dehydrogenase n=1 Tax=Solirubrobacter soli TaxID=363832 RepID=UPI00041D7C7D|nr:NAD-dependent succinate-semialdehyde dehydrogenase [Solirubrobacter soli]